MLAGPLGRGQRVVVVAEAVAEQRFAQWARSARSLLLVARPPSWSREQIGGLGPDLGTPRAEAAIGGERAPRRLGDRLGSSSSDAAAANSPALDARRFASSARWGARRVRRRPGWPRDNGRRAPPGLVVPEIHAAWPAGEGKRISSSVESHRCGRRRAPASGWAARGVSLGVPRREAVQEEIRRARGQRRLGGGTRGPGHLAQAAAGGQPAGENGRGQRVQIGLAGESRSRARVAWRPSATAGEHRSRGSPRTPPGLSAGPRARSRLVRACLGASEHSQRRVGLTGPVGGLRCDQSALRAAWLRGRQSCRPLQEGGRRRPPRTCGRPADRSKSSATSSSGPGAACPQCQARRSGSTRVGHRCECPVGDPRSAAMLAGRPRSARADAETGPWRRTQQAGGLCGLPRVDRDPELGGRPPHQHGSPSGSAAAISKSRCVSGGSDSSLRRTSPRSAPAGPVPGQSEPTGELCGGQPSRQLQLRQRITPRLGDEPVSHPPVQRRRDDEPRNARASAARRQCTSRSAARSTPECAGLARGEDDRDGLPPGGAAPRTSAPAQRCDRANERRRSRNHRPLVGHVAQEAQTARSTRKRPGAGSPLVRRSCYRVDRGNRDPLEPVEHRRAQLMQPGERSSVSACTPAARATRNPEAR